MIRADASRFLEDDEQRDHGKRRDHQQLVIIDVSDDLRLLRDHAVKCGAAGGGEGFQNCVTAGFSNARFTAVTCCAISA